MKNIKSIMPLFYCANLLVGLSITTGTSADTLSIDSAKRIALQAYRSKVLKNDDQANLEITDIKIKNNDSGDSLFYIVQLNHKGFVIVAATDQKKPVIAYGKDDGDSISFDKNNLAFNHWLEQYAIQLQARDSEPQEAITSAERLAPRNRVARSNYRVERDAESAIAPLTTTTWSQNGFYNDWVPNDYLTGCVATALGQFLKYYEYPTVGTGRYTYKYPDQDEITVDFASTTYHWESMANSLTEENDEVAKLLFHAGAAVRTLYGNKVSLAGMRYIPNALEKHFGYVTNGFEYVSNYAEAEWRQLILDELKAKRVVILTGLSAQGAGHAWVVDGYDGNDYFHMNWGWGGSMNGYFLLNQPNPRTNYNFNQRMAFVRAAPKPSLANVPFCQGTQYLTDNQGTITDGSGSWNYPVKSDCKFVIQPTQPGEIRLNFNEFATEHSYDLVKVYDGATTNAPLIGQYSGSRIPSAVTATSGSMLIHFTSDEVVTKKGWAASYRVQ
ncbi:C10 family peptidase [Spartinivicinus poritis]|uniref:C10 family peptidase n=1 Tax=Spartinivicinus poritis TaxID=2994640 RepID=A0ABT5UAM8_9GAMM|nr:C10 family peptidase [Spartinivicinus sp. A2-2]MDE1463429.1 C10 family peptidase [Spartinivicinus sp. A2-2]